MNLQSARENNQSKKLFKMILAVVWGIIFCLLLYFIWHYFRNAGIIENYNAGNRAFTDTDYELAKAYYEMALEKNPSRKQECRIRINEALSITTPITPESVTYDNLEQAIAELEGAIEILTVHGCADREDDNGHSRKAQILKNEIEDYINWLRDNVKPAEDSKEGGQDSDPGKNEKENDNKDEQQSKIDDLKKKIDEVQSRGMEERSRELSDYESYGEGYNFFDGKNW